MTTIWGTQGDDTSFGSAGDDFITGWLGNDSLSGYEGKDRIAADDGNDVVWGGIGSDVLYGGNGDDTVWGDENNDTVSGGDGNDLIGGGPGADLIYSGSGDDRYFYTSYLDSTPTSMDVLPDYAAGGPGVEGGGNIHLDRFDFSQMDANIDMPGVQHFTFLSYLPLTGAGQLHVRYVTPTDGYLEASVSGDGAPEFSIHMPGMSHQLLLSDFDSSVTDGFVEPPPVNPTTGTDWIYGTSSPETLFGLDGNDFIFGHELHGQTAGVNAHDNDLLYGGNGVDELRGGWGNDTLDGDSGNDVLYGGEFNDTLFGGDGNDPIVHGDSGNDVCYGGAGDDGVRGGKGIDVLYGDAGNDTFEFRLLSDSNTGSGVDTIMDYNQPNMGQDRIELSQLDADSSMAGDQAFNFVGQNALAHAGDLNAVRDASGNYIIVSATVDANSTPELSFRILDPSHLVTLTSADFLL